MFVWKSFFLPGFFKHCISRFGLLDCWSILSAPEAVILLSLGLRCEVSSDTCHSFNSDAFLFPLLLLRFSLCFWFSALHYTKSELIFFVLPLWFVGILASVDCFFFKIFIYFQRGGMGERKKGRGTSMWEKQLVASHIPPIWGPGLQPSHVPWLGIEPATFRSSLLLECPCFSPLSWQVQGNALFICTQLGTVLCGIVCIKLNMSSPRFLQL